MPGQPSRRFATPMASAAKSKRPSSSGRAMRRRLALLSLRTADSRAAKTCSYRMRWKRQQRGSRFSPRTSASHGPGTQRRSRLHSDPPLSRTGAASTCLRASTGRRSWASLATAAAVKRARSFPQLNLDCARSRSQEWDLRRRRGGTAIFDFNAGSHLAFPASRRLLVQHGRHDTAVTIAEAQTMFERATEPKHWRDYDCGHNVSVNDVARGDRIAFFQNALRGH